MEFSVVTLPTKKQRQLKEILLLRLYSIISMITLKLVIFQEWSTYMGKLDHYHHYV